MDLGNEPLLAAVEETALAQAIEAGVLAAEARRTGRGPAGATRSELDRLVQIGESARQRFVTANLRLVAMVAHQVGLRTGLAAGELFQEGCLGLLAAVDRFDHARGHRFSTYALCWIRAYVGAAASSAFGALNLPTSRAEQLRAMRMVEYDLVQRLGRAPKTGELAAALGRDEQWTAEAVAYLAPQPLEGADLDRFADEPDERALEADRPGRELLGHLGALDREVLELRLGFREGRVHSYAEIARRLAVSTSRVRRVEHRALEQLRQVCPASARIHLG